MWRGGSKGGADREDEPGIDRVGVAEVRIDIGEAERQRPDGRVCAERPIEVVAGGGEATVRAAEMALERDRRARNAGGRSEEHTSELQSLMRISYAVFCLKKKKHTRQNKE